MNEEENTEALETGWYRTIGGYLAWISVELHGVESITSIGVVYTQDEQAEHVWMKDGTCWDTHLADNRFDLQERVEEIAITEHIYWSAYRPV